MDDLRRLAREHASHAIEGMRTWDSWGLLAANISEILLPESFRTKRHEPRSVTVVRPTGEQWFDRGFPVIRVTSSITPPLRRDAFRAHPTTRWRGIDRDGVRWHGSFAFPTPNTRGQKEVSTEPLSEWEERQVEILRALQRDWIAQGGKSTRANPSMRSFHGSRQALNELQPGSMCTTNLVWAAGYTTRIDYSNWTESFVGWVHEIDFEPKNPFRIWGSLHDAESWLISMGRGVTEETGIAPPARTGLPGLARLVHEHRGYDAIVCMETVNPTGLLRDRVETNRMTGDMIPLVPVRVVARHDPAKSVRDALARGEFVSENLRMALENSSLRRNSDESLRALERRAMFDPSLWERVWVERDRRGLTEQVVSSKPLSGPAEVNALVIFLGKTKGAQNQFFSIIEPTLRSRLSDLSSADLSDIELYTALGSGNTRLWWEAQRELGRRLDPLPVVIRAWEDPSEQKRRRRQGEGERYWIRQYDSYPLDLSRAENILRRAGARIASRSKEYGERHRQMTVVFSGIEPHVAERILRDDGIHLAGVEPKTWGGDATPDHRQPPNLIMLFPTEASAPPDLCDSVECRWDGRERVWRFGSVACADYGLVYETRAATRDEYVDAVAAYEREFGRRLVVYTRARYEFHQQRRDKMRRGEN